MLLWRQSFQLVEPHVHLKSCLLIGRPLTLRVGRSQHLCFLPHRLFLITVTSSNGLMQQPNQRHRSVSVIDWLRSGRTKEGRWGGRDRWWWWWRGGGGRAFGERVLVTPWSRVESNLSSGKCTSALWLPTASLGHGVMTCRGLGNF